MTQTAAVVIATKHATRGQATNIVLAAQRIELRNEIASSHVPQDALTCFARIVSTIHRNGLSVAGAATTLAISSKPTTTTTATATATMASITWMHKASWQRLTSERSWLSWLRRANQR
jgi:hypothetical protein